MTQYGLGTTATNIKFLEHMAPAVYCPTSSLQEWSNIYVNSNGTWNGDGFPTETWQFAVLFQSQINVLRSYVGTAFGNASGPVYLRTRLSDGSWQTFTAIMRWPVDINSNRDLVGVYRNVAITFTGLEVVT